MRVRFHHWLASALAVLFLLATTASRAHDAPFVLTSVDWNASTNALEVIHRVHTHHAEDAVAKQTGARIASFDKMESFAALGLYIEERFDLTNGDGSPIPLAFVGAELEGDFVTVYEEAPMTAAPAALRVRNDICVDLFERQVNHVNVTLGETETTLIFRQDHRGAFLQAPAD